jgi:hypothetical protein
MALARFCATLITVCIGCAAPSHAYIDHPWCTGGGGWSGALTCSFDSYAQCRANARTCVANPASPQYPQSPQGEPRGIRSGSVRY